MRVPRPVVAASVASVVIATGVAVAPEQADAYSSANGPYFAGSMPLVSSGCGGFDSGGAVRGAELFLHGSGSFGQPSTSTKAYVDGTYDSTSVAAGRVYQKNHGLTVDGCIGYNTWHEIGYDFYMAELDPSGNFEKRAWYDPTVYNRHGVEGPVLLVTKEFGSPTNCWWFYTYTWRTFSAPGYDDQYCYWGVPGENWSVPYSRTFPNWYP